MPEYYTMQFLTSSYKPLRLCNSFQIFCTALLYKLDSNIVTVNGNSGENRYSRYGMTCIVCSSPINLHFLFDHNGQLDDSVSYLSFGERTKKDQFVFLVKFI